MGQMGPRVSEKVERLADAFILNSTPIHWSSTASIILLMKSAYKTGYRSRESEILLFEECLADIMETLGNKEATFNWIEYKIKKTLERLSALREVGSSD